MNAVARAAVIYLFLLVLFRLAGRRTLAQMTSFDLLVALIVSEGVSQGLTGQDHSVTNALVVASTLIGVDVTLSWLKMRWPRLDSWIEGRPMLIVEHGRPLHDRMRRARIDLDDVLAAAREREGLARLDQIEFAVLETSGGISIVPRRDTPPPAR